MKQKVIDSIAEHFGTMLLKTDIEKLLEVPPSPELGDFAFPCFSLAKMLRKNPVAIAEELKTAIEHASVIDHVVVVKGYVNIFIDKKQYAHDVLTRAHKPDFGRGSDGSTSVIEFVSPNSNKPLHLGHMRNMAIGDSVARILDFGGNKVVRTNMNNDRGIHICKSMVAYQRYGNGMTPVMAGKKGDHLVGDYYVLYAQKSKDDPSLEEEAKEMLRLWESGDPSVRELWLKLNTWVLSGFAQTYKLFGLWFDKEYFEHQIYLHGKEIVQEGLAKGLVIKRDDGATVIDLTAEGLGEKVLLRSDGTAVYIIQDLYLAGLKFQDFAFDRSLYVVGNEQDHHFKVLFTILKKLGFPFADKLKHLSYGMVELPEGKMKSREGTVVDADDLILETQELAREEIAKRYELSGNELDVRSLKITLAAIKYQLLKVDTAKNMVFDPKKAISFEGDTGPYLLYSYARASSILRKAEYQPSASYTIGVVDAHEWSMLKKIAQFSDVAALAKERLSPTLVAVYAFELAQTFSEFYHHCPVIKSDAAVFRQSIVYAFKMVMKNALNVLGIEEIEEM